MEDNPPLPSNPPDIIRRLLLTWSPGHTAIAIGFLAVAIGFLPFVKMGLVVNGVFLGAIIALGAVGLTLIYGILNFANIAHGDYMTMGRIRRSSSWAACCPELA